MKKQPPMNLATKTNVLSTGLLSNRLREPGSSISGINDAVTRMAMKMPIDTTNLSKNPGNWLVMPLANWACEIFAVNADQCHVK